MVNLFFGFREYFKRWKTLLIESNKESPLFDDYFTDNSEKAKEGILALQEYVFSKHTVGSALMFSLRDFSDEIEGKN